MNTIDRSILNHTYPSCDFILNSMKGTYSPDFFFKDEVKGALNSVLVSLKAYFESPNPVISFNDLKLWAVTMEGAAFLKKIRKKSIVKYLMGTFYDLPTWINDVPEFVINEIGDIFNYQYCFPWKAIDENDYLIAFTPLNIESSALRDFRFKFFELLEKFEEPTRIDPLEILLEVSSSVAQSNKKKVLHYIGKSKNLNFSKKRSPGKRTFITTAPSDGRDAIINEIADLNTIQWIDQQIETLMDNTELSGYLVDKDPKKFDEKFTEFIENNNFFLMRDIKKEGLQKPKVLLKTMLEVLEAKWPKVFDLGLSSFYDGPWFEGDTTGRGHGLGMANNLTTLMQIVIFSMLLDKIGEINLDVTIDMICHNDDIIIGINSQDDVIDDIVNLDCEILESLGIIVSRDKSFWSPIGGIICERYQNKYHLQHPKMSYVNREKLLLFTCFNVTHMKSCLSTYFTKFEHEIDIRELKSYFGYEFCPEEFDVPIDLGGWKRSKAFKISFELKYLEENFNSKILRLYLANKVNKIEIQKRKVQKFTPPALSIFPSKEWEKAPSEILRSFNFLSDREIYTKFTRIKKIPKTREKCWKNLYKKRQEQWLKPAPNVTFEQLVELTLREPRPIYPPDIAIDRWVDIKVLKKTCRDPHFVPNPICCALKKLGFINSEQYNPSFWPLISRTNDSIKKASKRKDLSRVINFIPPVYGFEDEDTILPRDSNEFEHFWSSYPAPLLIGKASEIQGKIPILKEKYHFKKDTWDFKITEEIFDLFQRYSIENFKIIMKTMSRLNLNVEKMNNLLEIIHSSLKVQKEIGTKDYIFESDDEFDQAVADQLREFKSDYPFEKMDETVEIEVGSLSWEESWDKVQAIEGRNSYSFDGIYYELDPTMREIIDQVKKIYSVREIQSMVTDEDMSSRLRDMIISFCDTYPDFLSLFELEDPRTDRDIGSSGDEGQYGDFNPDDFT